MAKSANIQSFFKAVLTMGYKAGAYSNSPQEEAIIKLLEKYGFVEGEDKLNLKPGEYFYQPNGKNNSPDFYVKTRKAQYSIEAKSSKGAAPTYNGGMPKKDTIYIFSSQKYDQTTIYFGKDVLGSKMRSVYAKLITELNNVLKKYQKEIQESDEKLRGFNLYIRQMFTQAGGANKTDYFLHPDRQRCEQNVLDSVG